MSTSAMSSSAVSPTVVPTSGAFRAVLLYDKNAPPTVVASIATAQPEDGEYGRPADYIEYHITCASPCAADFPAQTVTQKSGSIWGGHHVVSGTTTAWDCILGTFHEVDNNGDCYTTTLKSGEAVPTTGLYTQVGTCDVFAHSKLMFVTAGFDEYFKVMPTSTEAPGDYMTGISSILSSAKCPSSAYPTVLLSAAQSTIAPSTTAPTPAATASTAGPSASASKPEASTTPGKSAAASISGTVSLILAVSAFVITLQF